MVDHLYATLHRLDEMLSIVPQDAMPPLVDRINVLARKWGSEFGYGISDELTDFAEKWTTQSSGAGDGAA